MEVTNPQPAVSFPKGGSGNSRENLMKLVMIVAALCVGFALPAAAQCPTSMAYSDPGAEPVSLVLKYSWKTAETRPTALKAALEKANGVVKTWWDEKNPNRIVAQFRGRCDQISALETAARESGVPAFVLNHAHVSIVLKVQQGANVKGAIEALGKVPGALFAKASGTSGLEVHADLSLLTIDDMKAAVAPFKCEPIVNQTYEFVRFQVLEGGLAKFEAAASGVKGVMFARTVDNDAVGLWVNKSAFKADQIEKLDGFRVKKL
jgi:hypothetical protein